MNFNFYYNNINQNNYSNNLRITQTPQAIRNNQYNEFNGQFTIRPLTVLNPINNQNISTTYCSGKTFGTYR